MARLVAQGNPARRGRKALHDEAAIYAKNVTDLERADDRAAFAAAFNGVFFEASRQCDPVGVGIGSAAALRGGERRTCGAGHRDRDRVLCTGARAVPENAMKFLVGTMLTTFGIFWIGEGAGVRWWATTSPSLCSPR